MAKPANIKVLDEKLNSPKSVQIARYLTAEIQSGRLRPGEKMASVRTLAERYGVGRQVIFSAFQILERNNLIRTEVRRGSIVNPDIAQGRFYRIGLFINRNNPVEYGRMMESMYAAALRRGWLLVMGNNYEQDFELDDWLAEKADLDGIIITGVIEEDTLKGVAASCLPYLLYGSYFIADAHPSVDVLPSSNYLSALTVEIARYKIRRLAVFCGPEYHRIEESRGEAIKQYLQQIGVNRDEDMIYYTEGDGYPELCKLMENSPPDAIFFLGNHSLGWRRYLSHHPHCNRPRIFITSFWAHILEAGEYDKALRVSADDDTEERAVARLFELMHI